MSKVIYCDIDQTICHTPVNNGTSFYKMSVPIINNIEKINKLYNEGNEIVYWTARGNSSKIDWTELTELQLSLWGCLYTRLEMNTKPSYDILYDDKAFNLDNL